MTQTSSRQGPASSQQRLGGQAETPRQIPPRGWWQVSKRAWQQASADQISILAGGVAFFAFLALFPAVIAALTLYGLVADPAQVAQQMQSFASAMPASSRQFITDQLISVTRAGGGALTTGLVVSLLLALWSASSGTSNLMSAVNVAYDEKETRSFIKLRGTALGLTIGAIVFMLLALVLVAVVPAVLGQIGLGSIGQLIAQVLRWVLLVAVVLVGLAVIYRIAPARNSAQFRWVTPGALVATLLWIIGSVAFSVYVSNFGNYNATYGALAGVIVLMLWLFLTSYIVLLGAEINSESERQTERDSTRGEPMPMGQRGATAADTVADE
jgi:membrane protein